MSYLHCHNCNFSQDDYWEENGWNPIKALEIWKKELFYADIDKPFTDDLSFIKTNGNITRRELIAREFERGARKIRHMKFRNPQELKIKNPNRLCPICHQKTLDED